MFSERLRRLEGDNISAAVTGESSTSENVDSLNSESALISEIDTPGVGYEFAGLGIGLASMMAEAALSHPFVVLRGQCQVCINCKALHILPFSLFPVLRSCIQRQGPLILWKGLGANLVVRGLCLLNENLISELASLPKEVSRLSSVQRIMGHVLLKTISWIMITPFYVSSVIELVQSARASEPTNLLSCVRDGFRRLFHIPSSPRLGVGGHIRRAQTMTPITTSRLLPIWRLIVPVVFLNVGHYVIRSVACVAASAYWGGSEDRLEKDAELDFALKAAGPRAENQVSGRPNEAVVPPNDWLTLEHNRRETALQTIYTRYYTDLLTAMTANLVADVVTYPLETIVIRLCVQGTRTLVDSMDTGDVVIPIVSTYEGFSDAFRSAVDSPIGIPSLYRGFGALVAQYAIQAAFLYGIRYVYQRIIYTWFPPSFERDKRSPPRISQGPPVTYNYRASPDLATPGYSQPVPRPVFEPVSGRSDFLIHPDSLGR